MTSRNKTFRSVALVLGLAIGGFYVGNTFASEAQQESRATAPVPEFPANDNGQTYGSVDGVTRDDHPDLVLVEATNGRTGYVDNSLLDEATGANVSSPEEAIAWMEKLAAADSNERIPVYDADGKTQIGTFEIDRGGGPPPQR